MADFRTKILGMVGVAVVFAGVASAQTNCNSGPGSIQLPYAPSVPTIRAEGMTELVGDITFTCGAATSSVSSSLTLTINGGAAITSKTGINGGTSEVALTVVGGATTTGTVSGSSVNFTWTPPTSGSFQVLLQNVRINASALAVGTSVTATVQANSGGIALFSGNIPVALVATSLKAPALTTAGAGGLANPVTLVACKGSQNGGFAFAFKIAETLAGLFKKAGAPGQAGTETGPDSTAAQANATRFAVTISGIPSGVTAYLPTTINHWSAPDNLTPATNDFSLAATSSATGAFSAVTASTGSGVPSTTVSTATMPANIAANVGSTVQTTDAYGGVFALSPVNGVATAYYDVTNVVNSSVVSADVPVWLVSGAGKITAAGSVTATLTYASTGGIPNFAPPSLASVTGSQLGLCNTTLLFPYVTTLAGYETGIAITNTSTDPFGTANGASNQSGTCSLNFYGTTNLTTPTSITNVTAPNTTTSGSNGVIPSGQTSGFAVSTITGGPGVNFDGYIIAQCAFQYGHGFAYLLSNPTTPTSSTAMGYLALVIPDTTQASRNGALVPATPSEVLGN